MNLAALARRGAGAPRERLRGLGGDAWRAAESALLADVAARPARGGRIVAGFGKLARASGEPEAIGRAARLRGSALTHAGRNAESVGAYRLAARLLTGAARDGARIGLALALARTGRAREAVRLCRDVRRDAEARGDGVLAAAARMNEAVALHETGDPAAALPLYEDARAAFAAQGQTRHAARCADAAANALVLLERYDEALPLYDAAARELAAAGLAREAATTRYNRGELLAATDRLGEADAELEAAERALRAAGDAPTAALARLRRGEALLRAHLVPEARRLIRTALRAMGRRVPPADRTDGMLLAARAELAAGDAAAAARILARDLPLATPATRAARTELVGRTLAAQGRAAEARRTLERAASMHGDERPASRASALAAASWCATEMGDAAAGRRLARDAARAAAKVPVAGLRFAAAAAEFAAEDAAGRAAAASSALRRALAALEDLRAGLGPDVLRAALLRGSERWFARAVRHVLATEGPRAALELVERWRARALVDLLAAGDAVLPPDDRAAALRARLALLERRLGDQPLPGFLRATAAPSARCVAREIAAAERALRDAVERDVVGGVAPPPDPSRVAASLPPGTVLVSLFADDEGEGVAFVVDRDGVRAVGGLGSEREVGRLVEELHFRLGKFALGPEYAARHARRLAAETDAVLAQLAAATLVPLADVLRGAERVVVVPHGPWHRVPFAALPFDGGRLVDRVTLSATPSIAALAAGRPAAGGTPVVVAVPDPQAPQISAEARRVAAALPGARLLEGDDAHAAAFAWDVPPSVLHVAAHGRFRADAPALGGVRLADGWLRACEMARLRLDGSLVVLSGCDTGVVGIEGAEVLGLVRGVLAAGARELVVSLWRVDDAATAELMADLHAERARGLPTADALRAVQRSRSRAGAHPWTWAGFGLWAR